MRNAPGGPNILLPRLSILGQWSPGLGQGWVVGLDVALARVDATPLGLQRVRHDTPESSYFILINLLT